jgi:hypothetical protein
MSQDLLGRFTDALLDCSANFLTVMGLEFRNAFLEQSGFVGKDLDAIDEKALFHHMKSADPPQEFYDFLKDLWKAAIFEPLQNRDFEVFSVLADYQASKSDSQTPEIEALGKLNYYYNRSTVVRKDGARVYFGDIFRIEGNGNLKGQFLICITPTCDCLRPGKVHGNFHFVKGCKTDMKVAVRTGDRGYFSYIQEKGKAVCIEWQPKPFTIFIKDEHNSTSREILIALGDTAYTLVYVDSIKENYAQRIANHSFSYPLRVGIYFVNSENVPPVETECVEEPEAEKSESNE